MAELNTIRSAAGTRAAQIDEGLRAHMNKVYGTMSVGMLITALAAWAIAGLSITDVPNELQIGPDKYLTSLGYTLFVSPLKWVIMFSPLAFAPSPHMECIFCPRFSYLARLKCHCTECVPH